jgi:hypothetical protein
MDANAVVTAMALGVLLAPVLFLAFLGAIQVKSMFRYNTPILPKGSPGEAQRGTIIKGAK